MQLLASPITTLQPHYKVVVIGSGYGGGVAASRLARAGQQVCVLERGREIHPGEYPNTPLKGLRDIQLDTAERHIGSRTALFDIRVNRDINVVLGCGLGGTSLINANVAIEADPRVFADPRWPSELRGEGDALDAYYRHARIMLRPTPYPDGHPPLAKLGALERAAAALGQPFYHPPINVTFEAPPKGRNHVGVEQAACTLCGDCCSGCNVGAKNTTLMNYLPDAVNHGAAIFTGMRVEAIEAADGRWRVHCAALGDIPSPYPFITADLVFIAAGALGSTEILLRSAARGLALSPMVGKRFSGNGDALGFAFDTDKPIHGVGAGNRPVADAGTPGPCITGIIDARQTADPEAGLVIEDAAIPGVLAPALGPALGLGAALEKPVPGGGQSSLGEEAASLFAGAYGGPVGRTATFLVMSHDDAAGEMALADDRLRINWPGVGSERDFVDDNQMLAHAARALNGRYLENPLWTELFHRNVTTVHPLGGCAMADDAAGGVVNHQGQVFAGGDGTAIHPGLYVCDGAVIPRSLGTNPLLTITAIAERIVARAAAQRGWAIDYTLPSSPVARRAPAVPKPGFTFTERMSGFLGAPRDMAKTTTPEAFVAALDELWQRQPGSKSPIEFTFTITSDDIEEMLRSHEHRARITGTLTAPALSPRPLTVTSGEFALLVDNPDTADTRWMIYRARLEAASGETYYLKGFKRMQTGGALKLWPETSTLYVSLHRGASGDAPLVGMAIMRIAIGDFLRQLTTVDVLNAPSEAERLRYLWRFGTFFAGALYPLYGGVFAEISAMERGLPLHRKRTLQAPLPVLHPLQAPDGTGLLLTRYQGGTKGPVIMASAFGCNTRIFTIDTVRTNLTEYLTQRGYDLWLFDYRDSPLLPSASSAFTIDDVARQDWPTAVDYVRRQTGAPDVQVVAHCVGSMSFLMAMLSGMTGVRSAVCSQLTLHPVSWWFNNVKSHLHLARAALDLGIDAVNVDWHHGFLNNALDVVLRLTPIPEGEGCNSPVCRRIAALFGPSYKHAQLNEATHNAIHEIFGMVSATAFDHIATILNKGVVVDKDGNDVYMPHLDRLAFPIFFIAGADNHEFYPITSERTLAVLSERNGPEHYQRQVFPGYAHMDCFVGKTADADIFPAIARYLDATG